MARRLLTFLALALALASAPLVASPLVATPAYAETLAVDDALGDAAGRGPDIVRASVQNNDFSVIARVQLARAVRGDVIVSIDPRNGAGVRLVSELETNGHHTDHLLPGAFTDRAPGAVPEGCGIRVSWDPDQATVRLRLPSRCLAGGDYGAIRFAVLTERGADADEAPETRNGDWTSSPWISRG